MTTRLNYCHKQILAPMVRMGTLPLRLLSLDYGADIVYTEEIVDKRILRTRRVENDILGTVDYVDEYDGSVVFRTCAKEKERVVFQVGTSDAENAVAVGKLVEKDVAGFDVNMGCPKEFSLKGGMGAALLKQPEKVKDILTSLVNNLTIPVTCKIRLLPNMDETMKLCKLIESCGVAALAVHGRTKDERPVHPNNNEAIRMIAESVQIPIIANGVSKEIRTHKDIEHFRKVTGASSVMLARAAQWNCSIFKESEEPLPVDQVIRDYLKYAIDYDNVFSNTKYCIQCMLRDQQESPWGQRLLESKTMQDICAIWNMEDYNAAKQEELQRRSSELKMNLPERGQVEPLTKRLKIDQTFFDLIGEDSTVIKVHVRLNKKTYQPQTFPKSILLTYAKRQQLAMPTYRTERVDKLFYSTVTLDGKTYASDYLERNKKSSEQAAALAAIVSLALHSQNDPNLSNSRDKLAD